MLMKNKYLCVGIIHFRLICICTMALYKGKRYSSI